jgi:multiple sugar transport system substrate-binding protein
MVELELTMMFHGQSTNQTILELLTEFEKETHTRVHLQVLPWDTGRADLVNMGIYHHGADVSEVGSTWTTDLISMNSLRGFSKRECLQIGSTTEFLPLAWKRCLVRGEDVLAIPWTVSPMSMYYWKDHFQKASLEANDVFSSLENLEIGMQKLVASGIPNPWAVNARTDRYNTLHNLAGWIWTAGGDFIAEDGKQVLFNKPEAIAGIKNYLRLYQYLPVECFDPLTKTDAMGFFTQGSSSITVCLPWIVSPDHEVRPGERHLLDADVFPGSGFVGGSNLVVWEHTRQPEAALELVQFLTGKPSTKFTTELPARLEYLNEIEASDNPIYSVQVKSAKSGRTFPTIPLWGLIEDKLSQMIHVISTELLENPKTDLDNLIERFVAPLANRLNITLGDD